MDDNKKRKEKLNYNNNQKNILVKKQEIVGKMYKGERESESLEMAAII